MKYFLVNKELDFKRGYGEDIVFDDGIFSVSGDANKAFFFTRVFDSGIEGCEWHRFTCKGRNLESTALQFSFFSADVPSFVYEREEILFSDFIKNKNLDLAEKKKRLLPFLRKHTYGQTDSLLFDLKGRYMFVLVELFKREEMSPEVSELCFQFPKTVWLEHLPAVYSENEAAASFTERFLAIFQTVYDDLDFNIRQSETLLDPKDSPRSMLEELAGWYGFENLSLWPDDRLRDLIRKAPEINASIGTVKGLLDVLELFTGERPELTECWKVAESGTEEEKKIFGTDPEDFVISVKDKYTSTEAGYKSLLRVIDQCRPAHMRVRLRPVTDPADGQANTYLGINSNIGMGKDGAKR